jgi:hypothetical protein
MSSNFFIRLFRFIIHKVIETSYLIFGAFAGFADFFISAELKFKFRNLNLKGFIRKLWLIASCSCGQFEPRGRLGLPTWVPNKLPTTLPTKYPQWVTEELARHPAVILSELDKVRFLQAQVRALERIKSDLLLGLEKPTLLGGLWESAYNLSLSLINFFV